MPACSAPELFLPRVVRACVILGNLLQHPFLKCERRGTKEKGMDGLLERHTVFVPANRKEWFIAQLVAGLA